MLLALTGTPAATARTVPIGIGEQQPSVFSDPRWIRLGMVHARYLTPWDTLAHRHARGELDAWMAAARSARARVTLSFRHGHRARRDAREFPTPARFKAAFLGSRRRYPDVRSYIVWNEANHPLSYSAHHPRRVAKLFDVAARNCHGCRIVGADALDVTGMLAWVRAFLRGAHERPRVWGLHNYVGVRERQSFSTRALLAAVRGRIWFTETGGWLVRQKLKRGRVMQAFHTNAHQAARATRFALRLACVSRRIARVYLYNWQAPWRVTTWDSGIIGPRGNPRPAYGVLRRQFRRSGSASARCRHGTMR